MHCDFCCFIEARNSRANRIQAQQPDAERLRIERDRAEKEARQQKNSEHCAQAYENHGFVARVASTMFQHVTENKQNAATDADQDEYEDDDDHQHLFMQLRLITEGFDQQTSRLALMNNDYDFDKALAELQLAGGLHAGVPASSEAGLGDIQLSSGCEVTSLQRSNAKSSRII